MAPAARPQSKATRLGLGPEAEEPDGGGGGPTTIGGPAGLRHEGEEASAEPAGATATPVHLPSRSFGSGGQRSGGDSLDEDTRLPPPAPGLEPPSSSLDPPTMPGILGAGSRPRSGPKATRPRGQAPVRRMPESVPPAAPRVLPEPARPGRPLSGPDSEPLDGGDLTTPMSRLDADALLSDPSGATPKTSENAIPALPPPPSASSAQTPVTGIRRVTTSSALVKLPPVALAELPPIPAAPPSPGLPGAVRYLWPVVRGVWMRRKEAVRIRRSLAVVQHSLDGILLRLGRVAFEEGLDAPHLHEEMALLRQADERRAYALGQTTQLMTVRRTEEQRRGAQEAELEQAIAALSREAERLDGELRQRAAERRQLLGEMSRIDADLRRLARAAEQAEARAHQAQGPAASQAQAQAESARGQAEALRPQREARAREAGALEEPITLLTHQLAETRSELGLRRQELQRQVAEKAKLLAELDADMKRSQAEQEAAEREMQQRMMTIGTIINLHRESGPRYEPLYQEVDQIKAQLTAYEAVLARLDTEIMSYDQETVQKGLLLLGGIGLLLGLLVAALYVIWALSHR